MPAQELIRGLAWGGPWVDRRNRRLGPVLCQILMNRNSAAKMNVMLIPLKYIYILQKYYFINLIKYF